MNYSEDDNPLGVKSDFILSLCELIMGSRDGIEAEEKSVIDRCLPLVYQNYFSDPKPENMPILGDLYDCLRKQKEPQAQRIATALEIYVNGSLKVFNHQTNVELNNRIVCFDIKELGKQLKKLGMLIIQDQVWNRVTVNRGVKSTWYYIDEFHLLLKEEQTASYSVEIFKRFRKWQGIPTGITQNIKDLLASREIENILDNSDFILMLNQAAGDRQILAKQLNISPYQLSYVTNSGEGEGLTQQGHCIQNMGDLMALYQKSFTDKTVDRIASLPHPTVQKFTVITVAIVGASRRFLAQITRHQNEVKFMSASLQYSNYSEKAAFAIPYEILFSEQRYIDLYLQSCLSDLRCYQELCSLGFHHDSAGYALPHALRNILIICATPYEWKHMISQRICRRNTDETRIVMLDIWQKLYEFDPVLFSPKLTGPFCQRGCCEEGAMSCGIPIPKDWSPLEIMRADYPLLVEGREAVYED